MPASPTRRTTDPRCSTSSATLRSSTAAASVRWPATCLRKAREVSANAATRRPLAPTPATAGAYAVSRAPRRAMNPGSSEWVFPLMTATTPGATMALSPSCDADEGRGDAEPAGLPTQCGERGALRGDPWAPADADPRDRLRRARRSPGAGGRWGGDGAPHDDGRRGTYSGVLETGRPHLQGGLGDAGFHPIDRLLRRGGELGAGLLAKCGRRG